MPEKSINFQLYDQYSIAQLVSLIKSFSNPSKAFKLDISCDFTLKLSIRLKIMNSAYVAQTTDFADVVLHTSRWRYFNFQSANLMYNC